MPGLLNTLSIANSGIQAAQVGIDLTGNNLANVSNPSYARRRIVLESRRIAEGLPGGVSIRMVEAVRDNLLDSQVVREKAATAHLESRQGAFQLAQGFLGQTVDQQSSAGNLAQAAIGSGQYHLAYGLSQFFGAAQRAAVNPNSMADRQILALNSSQLADRFRQVDSQLRRIGVDMDKDIREEVFKANELLKQISEVSRELSVVKNTRPDSVASLQDQLQVRMEELGDIVSFESVTDESSQLEITIGGVALISSNRLVGSLATTGDPGRLDVGVVGQNGIGAPIGTGRIRGWIEARDGGIQDLIDQNDRLARTLMSEVNRLHAAGTGLDGAGGRDFFVGTGAGDIRVDAVLMADPRKIQLSGTGSAGDNSIAVAIGRLQETAIADLGGQTFAGYYNQAVAAIGQQLSGTNSQLRDQEVIVGLLRSQRQAVSGVNLDEEMSNLLVMQRAFQASARLVSTVDTLMETVIRLGR